MVLAAENDETRQTVSFLVACLVGIAVALAALTVWYWFHTDPKRGRQAGSASGDRTAIIEARDAHDRGDGGAVSDPIGDRVDVATQLAEEPTVDQADRTLMVLAGGADSDDGARPDAGPDRSFEDATAEDDRADEFVTGPLMARQTWDFVAAAKRAEDGGDPATPPPPAAPRIAVPDRSRLGLAQSDEADELAVVRRRREQEAARGLSDEVWDSVRRSVFDKLDG